MADSSNKIEGFSIVLRHIGGELKTLPVEYVAPNGSYLSIRWGQSGIYNLNLVRNVLTARSQAAQRKGKAHWVAADIEAVRERVKDILGTRDDNSAEAARQRIRRHNVSMP